MIFKHNMYLFTIAVTLLSAGSVAVEARTVTVAVDAKSGPWSTKANSKMKYGVGDEAPPFIITGIPVDSVDKVEVYADGVTTVKGKVEVGPVGFEDFEVNDSKARGKYYPSFYTPKLLYPAYQHALVMGFVDDKGVLVSRPFVVGEGVRVPIPEGATGLALGFNDVSFKDNSGTLSVTVTIPDQ
ncbi:hypothetical protein MMA231_03927 (plasmid) [Asticcacaulis sp. MM231]|uniref:hypothetical protein n=1 Tax=Asticcacaulis sp. MM231 TaxID=3157666 RepID=UPI0032D5A24A